MPHGIIIPNAPSNPSKGSSPAQIRKRHQRHAANNGYTAMNTRMFARACEARAINPPHSIQSSAPFHPPVPDARRWSNSAAQIRNV